MTVDQIVAETRQLPPEVRAEVAERILLTVHGGIEPRIEQAWREESRRRIAEIRSGKVEGIPGDQVSAEIRKIVGL